MRTTIDIDDELLHKAQALLNLADTTALVNAALTALIERESALRLARLGGGSEPQLESICRQRLRRR